MKSKSSLPLVGLILVGVWIWLRDLAWISQLGSTLPILLSLGWFFWLVSPWETTDNPQPLSTLAILVTTACLVGGMLTNLTLLLALGWALLLRSWIRSRYSSPTCAKANRLIVLPIMAFPWMTLDGDAVSSIFRLTAARFADILFSSIGLAVERTGTNLWIQGLPVTVNEECAGLGVLQAAMIAGVVLLEAFAQQRNRLWLQIPLLVLIAWLANTLRVIVLAVAALTWGPEFAAGPFHTWGGMGALIAVFGTAWFVLEFKERDRPTR